MRADLLGLMREKPNENFPEFWIRTVVQQVLQVSKKIRFGLHANSKQKNPFNLKFKIEFVRGCCVNSENTFAELMLEAKNLVSICSAIAKDNSEVLFFNPHSC